MGDMKTPDFDDLLAAFDIPDATSLDPKEAIQSTSDEQENHLKPSGMCLDENLSLTQTVPAPDVPAVSVIVKNTSRQESFEAAEKEGNHMGPTLLQNGFRGPEVGSEPHAVGPDYGKFEPGFINGDSSRGYTDKVESHKTEPLPTFSQFSPISSPEPEDSLKDNGVLNKQKAAESPYFPQTSMYILEEGCMVDSLRKPTEPELSMFDEYCKKEQKSDCMEAEKDRSAEQSRGIDKASSFLESSLAFGDVQDNSISEEKVSPGAVDTYSNAAATSAVCSSAVPPRQRIKPAHSKLSSCVAALVALQAKKVAVVPKEEPLNVSKEVNIPLKESIKGSPKMPKSPKSPRSPLEVVKKIIKNPDSPMSVCSDTSSKDSPSVCAGSPPAIPKVRIKTIKMSSGEIKRTVTRILPEVEPDDQVKSPEEFLGENSSGEDIKLLAHVEDVADSERERTKNSGRGTATTSSQGQNVASTQVANAKGDKKKGVPASSLQNPGSGSAKTSNSSQNKKQTAAPTKTASNSTTLLPKAVHLANLNLVPNSVTTTVGTKTTPVRQGQGAPMAVPLVHQVKIAAPVIVDAFNKLLHSANPVPTYTPNLNPPPDCNITLPATGYTCLECGDSFALEKSLAQHHSRRSIHIEVMCTQCSKIVQFYNKCSLLGHAREHKTKGLIMQCSQLMMKPISAEQLLVPPPLVAPSLAPQPSSSAQRTIAPTTSLGVWSGTSSYAPPAMPLYADPYGLIRHGFKCLECGKQVEDYTCLAGHYQRVAEEKDGLTCQVCQMMLPNKCSYGAHQRIHTHKSPYCCPECGVLCRSAYFQTHVKENCLHYTRKVAFRCIHCGVVFMSLGMLKVHIQDKHCEVFHKCSSCPMAFKSTESTAAHITAHHPFTGHKNAQVIYKCSCETVFNKKRLLHQHFYQNTNSLLVSVFKCPECQLAYMQKQLLVQHLKSVHGLPKSPEDSSGPPKKPDTPLEKNEDSSSAPKPSGKSEAASSSSKKDSESAESQHKQKLAGWTCGECSEWILDRETYVFHMKKSHGRSMKRYPCRQCERSFNSTASLRRHVKNNHDTKKDYTCCYCTEKPIFAKPSMLANHIILMHGIKNPELPQVSSSRTSASPAESGDREQTTGPKKAAKKGLGNSEAKDGPNAKKLKSVYKCAKCGFTADNSTEFLKHIPQHKKDNSTCQCVHCGLCYTSQISLNRHLFIVHKVKEEEEEQDARRASPITRASQKQVLSSKSEQGGSWECAQCELTFDLESAHAAHIRTHKGSPHTRQKTGSAVA